MHYIESVSPLSDYCLKVEMENGSFAIVDFKPKLNSAKYMVLKNKDIFCRVTTDGKYVIWKNGVVKITAKEVIGVLLSGEEE